MSFYQVEFVTIDSLVDQNHQYRKFKKLWDLSSTKKELSQLEDSLGADNKGYGIFKLFLALLLQFMEDLSDRELEEYLKNNISAKWFCDFNLLDKTPDYSLFSKVRAKIGTSRLSKIFNLLKEQLAKQGYMSEVFTFIDASHLISKASLWQERDKAIKEK